MDLKSAIDILSIHNDWRRDDTGELPQVQPKILGEAIDFVVSEFKNLHLQSVNASTYDKMFAEIEASFKSGAVDLCPNCEKTTKVYPNPYYYHECEHCGWKGSYNECKTVHVKELVKQTLQKYLR